MKEEIVGTSAVLSNPEEAVVTQDISFYQRLPRGYSILSMYLQAGFQDWYAILLFL